MIRTIVIPGDGSGTSRIEKDTPMCDFQQQQTDEIFLQLLTAITQQDRHNYLDALERLSIMGTGSPVLPNSKLAIAPSELLKAIARICVTDVADTLRLNLICSALTEHQYLQVQYRLAERARTERPREG